MAKNKLSETISIDSVDPNLVYVNNQWSFRLPSNVTYDVDCSFDGGMKIGIDLSNPIKTMVIKSKNSRYKNLLNFALDRHFHLLGNYNTLLDCKYDTRANDDSETFKQIIIADDGDFFVDIVIEYMFLFGNDVQIRVRGTDIEPFNFQTFVKDFDEDGGKALIDFAKEIANSITLISSKKAASTKSKKAPQKINDPNCIVEGTVLRKYIGKSKNIKLPDGLTEIPDGTFSPMSIESIVIPDSVKIIGRRVFEGCNKLTKVVLPSTIKELGGYCFCDCHKLQKIILPSKLKDIQDSMFSECYELDNVVIPAGVKYIEQFAFKNCRKFTSIVIPNGVESIGLSAFANCKNLEYLYIPASVVEIRDAFMGETPFVGCEELTVHCPSGSFAEEYCNSHGIDYKIDAKPKKVTVPVENAAEFDEDDFDPVAAEKAKAKVMDAISDISASLDSMLEKTKAMAEEARIREEKLIASGEKRPFKHKENTIVPEEFLKAIKAKKTFGYSDMYFEELFEVYDKLIEVSEADVDYIQWDTIESAKKSVDYIIEKIKEKEYVSIFSWSVEDVYDSIIFPKEGDTINNDVSKPIDFVIKNGVLEAYNGTASLVDIPEGVVEIADGALGDTGFISEVNLPESLETIGEEFINWSDCTELFIPKNVKSIHMKALARCRTLSNLSVSEDNEKYSALDGVLYNKDKTELLFYLDGKKDGSYTIPESVKTIGKNAFDKMYNSHSYPYQMLEKVIIPGNVELIGEAAFAGLDNLRVVEMQKGVKIIEKDVFKNCSKLKEVYIPETIEKLLVSVFTGCKSLKKIYVSDKLENEKVFVNIEKTATKFNAEIIKCDLESLKQKNEPKPAMKPVRPASEPPAVEETDEILKQKEKANRRIKELEEQIKSNNSSSSGSGLIAVGVLLVAFFLYCVIDNYNSYQILSEIGPMFGSSYADDSPVIASLVLLAISSIVVVFGFAKKSKSKKSKELNAHLQEEIDLLKDPENHTSYFKNEEKVIEETKKKKTNAKKKAKATFIAIVAILLAFVIGFYVVQDVVIPLSIYNDGIELLNNDDYYNAINTLVKVYDTKDASEKVLIAEKEMLKNANISDVVLMGRCNQLDNGAQEPIEWIVLERTDDKILLVSKYCLSVCDNYSEIYTVRRELAELADDCFSAEEKEMFVPTESPNFAGDNFFILNENEILEYFPDETSRKLVPTTRIYNDYTDSHYGGNDLDYCFGGKYIPWYTVTLGGNGKTMDDIWVEYWGDFEDVGLRPAVWVSVNN